MADSGSERNPVEQLAEEFAERQRRGERPSLTEYTDKYPQWADDIRDLFPALVLMEQFKPAAGEATGDDGTAPAAESTRLERLGDFRILREIGRGGMGVVYEAEQLSLGRHVALKVLPGHHLLDPRHLARFEREAKAAARLHHTNIVPVYGVGEQDGLHYYVMQFIQGQSLDQVLGELKRLRQLRRTPGAGPDAGQRPALTVAKSLLTGQFGRPGSGPAAPLVNGGPPPEAPSVVRPTPPVPADASSSTIRLPGQADHATLSDSGRAYWESVARISVQVAEALHYANSQGTLHRDVKPSNLLIDTQGTLWVTDFGLAKAVADTDNLTQTGDVVGTLRYMAPERFHGPGDARSDVYSLGLTLYELLTLRPAFDESDRNKLLAQVMQEEPPRPRKLNPAVPCDLETIVLKALARDPAHRYQRADELAADLKRFVEDRPIRARRVGQLERLGRWCRRNPALAALGGAVGLLLVGITLVSAISATVLHLQLRRAEQGEAAEKMARQDALDRLWGSYLAQAKAGHYSRRIGQRFASLDALRAAAQIGRDKNMSAERLHELRNEAIACLALPDVRVAREWDGVPSGSFSIDFDGSLTRYARTDRQGNVSVRHTADDVEIAHWPGFGVNLESWPLFSRDGRFVAVGTTTRSASPTTAPAGTRRLSGNWKRA